MPKNILLVYFQLSSIKVCVLGKWPLFHVLMYVLLYVFSTNDLKVVN